MLGVAGRAMAALPWLVVCSRTRMILKAEVLDHPSRDSPVTLHTRGVGDHPCDQRLSQARAHSCIHVIPGIGCTSESAKERYQPRDGGGLEARKVQGRHQ